MYVHWIVALIALFVGIGIGIFVMALCKIASETRDGFDARFMAKMEKKNEQKEGT